MSMDLKSVKSKLAALQQSNQKKEKVDYSKVLWKPKEEGKYQIRIVPSKFDKKNPFKEVFIHYGFAKFPIYALTNWNEKDPIVEFSNHLRETNSDKESWILSKKLEPKMRVFAPVIVRGEEAKGVRLWEFGKEIYMNLLGIAEDEDYGDYTDINEGRDFTVELVMGDIGGRRGLKSSIRVKPKTSQLSDNKEDINKWLEEQPDILSIQRKQTFEALKTILEKFLNPEEDVDLTESVGTEIKGNVDEKDEEMPWEKESEAKTAVKEVKVPKAKAAKAKKADAFDKLFEDEAK